MQLYLSDYLPKYMVDFIDYAVEYLDLDKLRGEIFVEYKRRLPEESYGECFGDRSEVEINIAQTTFGQGISREDKLKTIAHELTHARQYLTGTMRCVSEGKRDRDEDWVTHWKKRKYKYRPDKESSQPWEVEAVKYEKEIYDQYLEEKHLYK